MEHKIQVSHTSDILPATQYRNLNLIIANYYDAQNIKKLLGSIQHDLDILTYYCLQYLFT